MFIIAISCSVKHYLMFIYFFYLAFIANIRYTDIHRFMVRNAQMHDIKRFNTLIGAIQKLSKETILPLIFSKII